LSFHTLDLKCILKSFISGKIKMKMHYRNDWICVTCSNKNYGNDHSNFSFLNCIYTHSQDTCDCIFMKCPAMKLICEESKTNIFILNT